MTAKDGTFWTLVIIGGAWAIVMLVGALQEFWRRHKRVWHRRPMDGDYLDLRPRYASNRRHWW